MCRCHYARPPWTPCIVLLIYAKVGLASALPSPLAFPLSPPLPRSPSFPFLFHSYGAPVNYGVRATKSSGLIELLLESLQYCAWPSRIKKERRGRGRRGERINGREEILPTFLPFVFLLPDHPPRDDLVFFFFFF